MGEKNNIIIDDIENSKSNIECGFLALVAASLPIWASIYLNFDRVTYQRDLLRKFRKKTTKNLRNKIYS